MNNDGKQHLISHLSMISDNDISTAPKQGENGEWVPVEELWGSNLAVSVILMWLVFIWHIIHIRQCFPVPHATLDLPLSSLFQRHGTSVMGTIWHSLLAQVRLYDYCQAAWTRVLALTLLLCFTPRPCICHFFTQTNSWVDGYTFVRTYNNFTVSHLQWMVEDAFFFA